MIGRWLLGLPIVGRLIVAVRMWRDRGLAYNWSRAWRAAGRGRAYQ